MNLDDIPSEQMLTELVKRGVLERDRICHEPGWTRLVEVDWKKDEA